MNKTYRVIIETKKNFKKVSSLIDCYRVNSLPNEEILDLTKLKAFPDFKINATEMFLFVFDRVENIVRKGGNVGQQHFLLFPRYFQKASSAGLLKSRFVW